MPEAEVLVDLTAVRANVKLLGEAAGSAALMAVVKAAGYGHGAPEVARTALDAGASWLGVCYVEEALELRDAGLTAPVLAWLTSPDTPWSAALEQDVDVSVNSLAALAAVCAAARSAGVVARLHLEVDTGLGRGGVPMTAWPALAAAAAGAERSGAVRVVGIWSHLACADMPGHASVPAQLAAYREALRTGTRVGLRPDLRHVANSAATLLHPAARFDLVRPGIALYGIPPVGGSPCGLRPAMTLRTVVASVGRRAEGLVAVLPVGQRDGLLHASRGAEVLIGRSRYRVAGRVGVDHTRVWVDERVRPGDEVVVFGPGDRGEPTAEDWAGWAGTIGHEVITHVGDRVPRRYVR
ncbi:MAG: alanine racemase [Actinocatenispora sp.]